MFHLLHAKFGMCHQVGYVFQDIWAQTTSRELYDSHWHEKNFQISAQMKMMPESYFNINVKFQQTIAWSSNTTMIFFFGLPKYMNNNTGKVLLFQYSDATDSVW